MEGELGYLSPAAMSPCVSAEGFGSPISGSPREKLLDSSPSSCVSDDRGGGCRLRSPTSGSSLEMQQLDSPSSCVSDGRGGSHDSPLGASAEQVREAERLLRAISDRYDDCFIRLRDAMAELSDLRLERLRLRAENVHLSLLLEDLEADQRRQAFPVAATLPLKPAEEAAARGGAPKSISIRSKSYLAEKHTEAQRLRVRAAPAMEEAGEDEEKGDGEVEVDAYRQGSHKTELCNKWERGACPFGGRCRFAHGLQEMRPVIRHPRYKTQPCQMMAAASGCPYGHRCHFRHSPAPADAGCY